MLTSIFSQSQLQPSTVEGHTGIFALRFGIAMISASTLTSVWHCMQYKIWISPFDLKVEDINSRWGIGVISSIVVTAVIWILWIINGCFILTTYFGLRKKVAGRNALRNTARINDLRLYMRLGLVMIGTCFMRSAFMAPFTLVTFLIRLQDNSEKVTNFAVALNQFVSPLDGLMLLVVIFCNKQAFRDIREGWGGFNFCRSFK